MFSCLTSAPLIPLMETIELEYKRWILGTGIQLVLRDKLVPYVQFDYSKMNFESEGSVETVENGSIYNSTFYVPASRQKSDVFKLVLGMGFLF